MLFPLASSVTVLPEAILHPQPSVQKEAFSTLPSFTLRRISIVSPQEPVILANPSGEEISPRFLGLRKWSIVFSEWVLLMSSITDCSHSVNESSHFSAIFYAPLEKDFTGQASLHDCVWSPFTLSA